MRAFLLLLASSLAIFGLSSGQDYTPKPGETVLKLVVQERGNIYVKLYLKEAPKTTARISELAKQGFYNGQRFHKVVRTPRPFVAQIGDPASKDHDLDDPKMGEGGTGVKIPYEDSGFSHEEGAVSLAHLPNDKSGDCQFFFVLGSSTFLNGRYTVFGKVVAGMDVMRTLQQGDTVRQMTVVSN